MMIDDCQPTEVEWCDTCRSHVQGCCDGCKRPWARGERHYRSQSYHYHPAGVGGISGTRGVNKELCVDCYRLDHAAVYPALPVPPLPDRIAA